MKSERKLHTCKSALGTEEREGSVMKSILTKCILSVFAVLLFFSMQIVSYAAESKGVNVDYHTKEEILKYLEENGVDLNADTEYSVEASNKEPYAPGQLTDASLQSALKTLNAIRYIAGLDPVELNDEYNKLAQAAALVNSANDELTHFPKQPAGMEDELYQLGHQGAGSSNISSASWETELSYLLINGWMNDGDNNNISRVGHRRWCLNPTMGKTGFGWVSDADGTYAAMYAHDRSATENLHSGVTWPAQNMPIEYFGNDYPWSISMGAEVDDSSVRVTLTRKNDNRVWNFYTGSTAGNFSVDNGSYGQKGCIIFRPDNVSYQDGDQFQVTITGLEQEVSYTVNFFNVHTHSYNEKIIVEPSCTHDGMKTYTCSCGDSYSESIPQKEHSVVTEPAKEPTCMQDGKTEGSYCEVCGEVLVQPEIVKSTGHLWDTGVVTKKPTKTTEGVKTYTCQKCKSIRTESIAATGSSNSDDDIKGGVTENEINKDDKDNDDDKATEDTEKDEDFEDDVEDDQNKDDKKPNNGTTISKKEKLKVNDLITDKSKIAQYRVVSVKGGTVSVEYKKNLNTKATSITIPATIKTPKGTTCKVTAVGNNALKGNKKIKKVTIGNNVKTIGAKAFYACSKLTTVKLGKNVTTVNADAFSNCTKLSNVTLDNNLTVIGNKVFAKCTSLKKLTIPAKVKKIGKQAFYDCKNLKTVTIKSVKLTTKNVGKQSFKGINAKAKIKVPSKKLKNYQKILRSAGVGKKVNITK